MISAKLEELKRGKQELVNSVNERRGTDYDISVKWDKLADEIERVGFQSGTLETLAERKISYERVIPNKALEYVMLNNVGGMSYTSENLLNIADVPETTEAGITYSITDGVIKVKGTATYYMEILKITINSSGYFNAFPSGTLSSYSGFLVIAGGTTYYNEKNKYYENITEIRFYMNTDDVIDATYKPMLVKGSVAPTEYKQYFSGIRDSKVTSVVNNGANVLQCVDASLTNYGATLTTNTQGHFKVYKPDNASFDIQIGWLRQALNTLPKGTYTLILFNLQYNTDFQLVGRDINDDYIFNWWAHSGTNYITFEINDNFGSVYTYTNLVEGIEEKNYEFDLMIVRGSTAPSEYVAYIEPTTLPIAELIQNLEGYGLGIDATYNNYIDYYNKKYVQKVKKIVVDGVNYGTRYVFPNGFTEIRDLNTGVTIRDAYPSINSWGENYAELYSLNDSNLEPIPRVEIERNAKKGIALNNGTIAIKLDNSTDNSENNWTADSINAYLQENPITIIYVLANPIEHDLSAYDLPLLLKTQSLGSLTFTNEYQHDIPNTITWQEVVE